MCFVTDVSGFDHSHEQVESISFTTRKIGLEISARATVNYVASRFSISVHLSRFCCSLALGTNSAPSTKARALFSPLKYGKLHMEVKSE